MNIKGTEISTDLKLKLFYDACHSYVQFSKTSKKISSPFFTFPLFV